MLYWSKPVVRGDGGLSGGLRSRGATFPICVCMVLSRANNCDNGDPMLPEADPPAPAYYVDQTLHTGPSDNPGETLELTDLVERALRIHRALNGSEPQNPDLRFKRACSIVAPPGGGKSTFLTRLRAALAERPQEINVPPTLTFSQGSTASTLDAWLAPHPGRTNAAIWALCQANQPQCLVFLVDGHGEAPGLRDEVEQVLAWALTEQNTLVVIGRRDEYALENSLLRPAEQVLWLRKIETPRTQIERRLEGAVAVANPAGIADPHRRWDAELDNLIVAAALDEAARRAVVDQLEPFLTHGPLINLLWLEQKLLHMADPPLAHRPACLAEYIARAGAPAECYGALPALIPLMAADNSFTSPQSLKAGLSNDCMDKLQSAGVINLIHGTTRYQLSPGVATLI